MDSQELGRQVYRRRKVMGLSQVALAQSAGVSRNYISLIERGEARNISMDILSRLALALEITPADLIGHPGERDMLIPPALRQFGLHDGLSYDTVDRLARIPRRGHEPQTVKEWRELYKAIRPYLEQDG